MKLEIRKIEPEVGKQWEFYVRDQENPIHILAWFEAKEDAELFVRAKTTEALNQAMREKLQQMGKTSAIVILDNKSFEVPGDHKEGHVPQKADDAFRLPPKFIPHTGSIYVGLAEAKPEEALPEPDVILEILPSQEGW